MAFKSARQRKAFFGRISRLPDNLINPFFIPKGSKFVVTKSKGIRAFTARSNFFEKKERAVKFAKETKTPIFKIPKSIRVFSVKKKFSTIKIR